MAVSFGTIIEGKYEIQSEIGRGGMSIVYLARDTHLNKLWAVKEIKAMASDKKDEIVINSLLAEANLMKKLDHPALPRIVDIINNGQTITIVMDFIEGESLDKILLEYGAQPEELVIEWSKQLCDALNYLHNQKPPIIYRDMKPANVMLKPEGNIKVIDFGIAREYKEMNLADTTVLGTKGYAPPEQYQGRTDIRSDIYALGMTMHHLLTGIDPRPADYEYRPVRQWNPLISDGIEAIINKCVQPAAENRYQNCAELMYDLEHPDLVTKDYKRRQKRKLGLFVASLAMSAIMVVSGFACSGAATSINNSDYDRLVSATHDIQSYKSAIGIYPERPQAYIAMLEEYISVGKFTKTESDEFLAVYNQNKSQFSASDPEVAMLNYQAGLMCLNLYSSDGVSSSASGTSGSAERIQMAFPFFETIHNNMGVIPDSFEEKEMAERYYQICDFNRQFFAIGIDNVEPTAEKCEFILDTLRESMNYVDLGNEFEQLSVYSATEWILHESRFYMVKHGIDEARVTDLFEEAYTRANALDTVSREKSVNLRDEILTLYPKYKEDIVRAYSNARERG